MFVDPTVCVFDAETGREWRLQLTASPESDNPRKIVFAWSVPGGITPETPLRVWKLTTREFHTHQQAISGLASVLFETDVYLPVAA